MSKSILDRIRGSPGEKREQETEDEDVIIAKKISTLDQQVKAMQGQLSDLGREYTSTKDMLGQYIKEQRSKMQTLNDDINKRLSQPAQQAPPAIFVPPMPAASTEDAAPKSGPTAPESSLLEAPQDAPRTPPPMPFIATAPGALGESKVTQTVLSQLMRATNMLTYSAHHMNEQAGSVDRNLKELLSQLVVISMNLTDLTGRLVVIENHLHIKIPPKAASEEKHEKELADIDPETIKAFREVEAEADKQVEAAKKNLIKKKLAEKFKIETDEAATEPASEHTE